MAVYRRIDQDPATLCTGVVRKLYNIVFGIVSRILTAVVETNVVRRSPMTVKVFVFTPTGNRTLHKHTPAIRGDMVPHGPQAA